MILRESVSRNEIGDRWVRANVSNKLSDISEVLEEGEVGQDKLYKLLFQEALHDNNLRKKGKKTCL